MDWEIEKIWGENFKKTIGKIGGKFLGSNCSVNVLAPPLWNGCMIRQYHLLIGRG